MSDNEQSSLDWNEGQTEYEDPDGPVTEKPDEVMQEGSGEAYGAAGAFSDAFESEQIEVRDPYETLNLDDWTPTQVEQWEHMLDREQQYFDDLQAFRDGEIDGADVRKPLIADLGGVGSGKAQPLDAPVLTPHGWTTMGEIEPGDRVMSDDGTPTTVTAVHPQGETEAMSVVFNDETSVICNPDHLWDVQTLKDRYRGYGFRTKSTRQIKSDIEGGADTTAAKRRRFVPTVDPVQFESKSLPLHPYLVGALIGDGMLKHGAVRFTSADKHIIRRIDDVTNLSVRSINGSTNEHEYQIAADPIRNELGQYSSGGNSVHNALRMLGLAEKGSHDKFVPEEYKYASVKDRVALLRGLMDTDGTVTDAGTATFCTVSRSLADDVSELVRSLGARTRVRKRSVNGGCGYAFRVRVNMDINPFSLPRKADMYNTDAKQGRTRKIECIERVEPREMKCITVDSPSQLYVTKNYTVTHNSYTGAGLIAPRQVQLYDGSIGLFCANTLEQTESTLLPRFKKGMAMLGFSWDKATYHKEITYRGEVYKHTIAIHLTENTTSFIRLGSFKSADRLESEEFDWGILSEINHADELDVKMVRRRIRSMYANGLVYMEGTPEKKSHWMYEDIPEMGFDVWMSDTRDNPHKQPGYAADLRTMYGKARAEAMVTGCPIETSTDAIYYNFDEDRHVEPFDGEMAGEYDPDLPLHIFFDFNLSPMSVGVFQPKDGSDLDGYADRLMVQIDELEGWQGGTRQMCQRLATKYRDHRSGGLIAGDGTDTKSSASPDQSDWDIVKSELGRELPMMKVQPGTYKSSPDGAWKNPPTRDKINAGNWLLEDGRGVIRCIFLESDLESGGVAASVREIEKNEDGKPDKTIDRTKDRSATQSHFSDLWGYMAFNELRKIGGLGTNRNAEDALDEIESLIEGSKNRFGTANQSGNFHAF